MGELDDSPLGDVIRIQNILVRKLNTPFHFLKSRLSIVMVVGQMWLAATAPWLESLLKSPSRPVLGAKSLAKRVSADLWIRDVAENHPAALTLHDNLGNLGVFERIPITERRT